MLKYWVIFFQRLLLWRLRLFGSFLEDVSWGRFCGVEYWKWVIVRTVFIVFWFGGGFRFQFVFLQFLYQLVVFAQVSFVVNGNGGYRFVVVIYFRVSLLQVFQELCGLVARGQRVGCWRRGDRVQGGQSLLFVVFRLGDVRVFLYLRIAVSFSDIGRCSFLGKFLWVENFRRDVFLQSLGWLF